MKTIDLGEHVKQEQISDYDLANSLYACLPNILPPELGKISSILDIPPSTRLIKAAFSDEDTND